MTIGGKYQWKPDSNPPVGAYDVNSAIEFIKPSAPSTKIINNKKKKIKTQTNVEDIVDWKCCKQN